MNFIADAMLGSLTKRLRLLGCDVLYDPAWTDNDVLRISLSESRLILTRDTGLATRPLAHNHLLIRSDQVDDQVRQVLDAFPAARTRPFTRCSVCNGSLDVLDRKDAQDRVPEHVFRTVTAFMECAACGRVYWEGSHVRNMAGARKESKATEQDR